MAVRIRLKRTGTIKKPRWRLVVADSRSPRDGRYIEEIGFYNPTTHPVGLKIKMDRYNYWVKVGAQPTDTVKSLAKRQVASNT